MIILYISWRRFQNIWNKKTEPFLKIYYHGLKNFQKGFENNSSQEPPITAVLNFSMYSLLSVYIQRIMIVGKGKNMRCCGRFERKFCKKRGIWFGFIV